MLRQRLLTAAVLLPFFVWSVLWLPTRSFSLILGLVALVGANEWATLMAFERRWRPVYVLGVGVAMVVALWASTVPGLRLALLLVAVGWWVAALGRIQAFQREGTAPPWLGGPARGGLRVAMRALAGLLTLVPAWVALTHMHAVAFIGHELVLAFMLLVWGADSGAYATGRRLGRHRLAGRVSPGKTWEGVGGALVVGLAVSLGAAVWFDRLSPVALVGLLVLGLATVLVSIVGDLFESLVKRVAGVKDSGRLLPGHGGILDRIDSITAAAPVFALGLIMQGVML